MYVFSPIFSTYRQPFLGVRVTESLYVVKDQPSQRDDHQHDEGDGHEEDRRLADVIVVDGMRLAHVDLHGDASAVVHKPR